MTFFRNIYWSLLTATLLSSGRLWASTGTEGAAFLDIPVGAGPAALGSAYTASATDAYAPVWNPAGLGFVGGTQVAVQHLSYLESIHYEFASFAHSFQKYGGIGASIQYLGSGDIAGTSVGGASTGDFSSYFASYNLAYGLQVAERLSVGVTGKLINAKISDVSATAFATDLGALYHATEKLSLASSLTNLGNKLTFENQSDSLPLAFHFGGAYAFGRQWTTMAEGVHFKTGSTVGRWGLQWKPLDAVSIRAGYKTDNTRKLSALAGLTTGIGIALWDQEFAYAWVPYGDLGDTQYLSLLLKFGLTDKDRQNLIHYRSQKNIQTAQRSESSDPEYGELMQLLKNDRVHPETARSSQ